MVHDVFRVLVARPQPQATELGQLIADQSWQPVLLPAIDIQPLAFQLARPIEEYSALIFISQNAVHHFVTGTNREQVLKRPAFAIGQSTARALMALGVEAVQIQTGEASSENLLSHPELQSEAIEGSAILLIGGEGGRDLLEQQLLQRGARLERLAVYRRTVPCYDQEYLHQCWQPAPNAMVITSIEVADNLITLLKPCVDVPEILSTPAIVLSERIRDHLLGRGFESEILVTEDSSNDGIMASLKRFAKEVLYE